MSQPEARLSRKIQDALKARGAFCFKVWGSEHMMAGLPDIICCYQGRFIAIETKMPEKEHNVSKVQFYVMNKITKAGGMTGVVSSVTQAEKFLDLVDAEKRPPRMKNQLTDDASSIYISEP